MRQGTRQALYYMGQESLLEDEVETTAVVALVDGWITKQTFFAEMVTAFNVGDEMLQFHVNDRDNDKPYPIIQGTLTLDDIFNTAIWASENAVSFHAPAEDVPYYVMWPLEGIANDWLELELIGKYAIRSGHNFSVDMKANDLDGVNTAGEIDVIIELKQLLARKNFT